VYGNHTHLLALLHEVVDGLTGSLGGRTHQHDDVLSIFGTVVVEQVILAAGNLGDFAKIVLHDLGHLVIIFVASLAMCEECLGVLGCTAGHGALGSERTVAEAFHVLGVEELGDILLVDGLDLMILV